MFLKKVKMLLPDAVKRPVKALFVIIFGLARVGVIFKHLSYASVATATVVAWIVGALWYSPFIFGEIWMASPSTATNLSNDLPNNLYASEYYLLYPAISLAATFINALVIAGLAGICGISGWLEGIIFSIWIGIGLLVVSMLSGYVFINISGAAVLVDIGYVYIRTLILCLFAALWHKNTFK